MKKAIKATLILSLAMLTFGCQKEDPPAPGEKTNYPGTPDTIINPVGNGTVTFWVDQTACGFLYNITVTVWNGSFYGQKTISYSTNTEVDCLNSQGLGVRFDLDPGIYNYSAIDANQTVEWSAQPTISVLDGSCISWKLYCF